jgi:hypothetical protein
MRPNNQNKRSRGRNNNNGRKNSNPLSRNYESNGPDVKIRGNASHIAEKYVQLARDAQSTGDSVMAENYLQHAEHYFRIVSAAQALNPPRTEQPAAQQPAEPAAEAGAAENAPAAPVVASASPSEDGAEAAPAPSAEEVVEQRKPRARRPRRKPVQKDTDGAQAQADVASASAEASVKEAKPAPAPAEDGANELPAFLTNGQSAAAE